MGQRTILSVLMLTLGVCTALASPVLTRLVSFGVDAESAANPIAELIEGSDGKLYGTTALGGSAGQGTVFRIGKDGSAFLVLRSFSGTNDGSRPVAAVIQGSDAALYGTTSQGGQFGFGTVFRTTRDGANFSILKHFAGSGDGAYPEGRLLEASDGFLYGTTSGGGTNDNGIVFRLSKDGISFAVLYPFTGSDGANPAAGLIEASDGRLYGTTACGGNTNNGVAFGLDKNGGNFVMLQSFGPEFYSDHGATPLGRLVETTNGTVFGTANVGGFPQQAGTLFQLNKDGSGFLPVYQFTNSTNDARFPASGLILASDGWLYGCGFDGGTNGGGAVFRIGQDGSNYTVIAAISGLQGIAAPLLEGSDGFLYGTAQVGGIFGAGGIFKVAKDGTGFTILKSFSQSGQDGASPYAPLAKGSDGALYGTTRLGGSNGRGTVFSVAFDGRFYKSLSSLIATNGAGPLAGVLEAGDGLLYGVTRFDDALANVAVFSLGKDGSGLSLVLASASTNSGREARGTLVQGTNGFLYGTSALGGTNGQGTVFQINQSNSTLVVLKNFAPGAGPGANPLSGLLLASDGRLYGTAYAGGLSSGNGTVFAMNQDGSGFVTLKSFGTASVEGMGPIAPLLEASDGMLYGTTCGGGPTNGAGSVFRLNKNGSSFQVIHTFLGTNVDGRHPCGKLAEGADGAIYGTTDRGGTNDCGTVFRLNKNGSAYSVLANLSYELGSLPRGGLTVGPDGAFYGTAASGGAGFGTIFRFGEPIEEVMAIQVSSGLVRLVCMGIAGTNYSIERSAELGPSASWQLLASTNCPAGGSFQTDDLAPPARTAFYRMRR